MGRGGRRGGEAPPDQPVPRRQERGAVGGDGDVRHPARVEAHGGAQAQTSHCVPDLECFQNINLLNSLKSFQDRRNLTGDSLLDG